MSIPKIIPNIVPNKIVPNSQIITESFKSDIYRATRPCSLVQKQDDGHYSICTREICTFAHFLEELRILPCKYFTNCRNGRCTYLHFQETTDLYYKRTGQNKPDIPTKMQYDESKNKLNNKFIINIDHSDNEEDDNNEVEQKGDEITLTTVDTVLTRKTVLRFPKEFLELDGVKEILFIRSMTGLQIELV
jgi:hypothetical protein